jgi:TRAP transporter TAXI family solute receptor
MDHVRHILITLLVACYGASAFAAASYKIVTASDKGTYYAIGKDLAKFVAPDADMNLDVVATDGSAANIKLLRYEPGVKLAIVQADVYQAFVDSARSGNPDAQKMIQPLRVILPLYNTEIHYIVRSDSPLNYLHDIKDAKINGGLIGSGAALITHTLYRMMFNQPIPEGNASFVSNEEALVKLVRDKTIDVVVVAAGQPAPLIANMKPEAQKFIKLLKFDPNHPSSHRALTTYSAATVRASSYPNLLKENFTTIAVGAYLVTYDFNLKSTVQALIHFAGALCDQFPKLQAEGHPKWREVELAFPKLGPGWNYYGPTTREIRSCIAGSKKVPAAARNTCSPESKIIGLCS